MSDSKKEAGFFLNPVVFDKDGKEVSICKFGAKVSSKYNKLFDKLDGKSVKLVIRVRYYDPDDTVDLEGFSLEPTE